MIPDLSCELYLRLEMNGRGEEPDLPSTCPDGGDQPKSGCRKGVHEGARESLILRLFARVCVCSRCFVRIYLRFGSLFFRKPEICVCARSFAFANIPFITIYTPFYGTLTKGTTFAFLNPTFYWIWCMSFQTWVFYVHQLEGVGLF